MIRYLTVAEVVAIHSRVIDQSGGSHGLRDPGALDSAVSQSHVSFGGELLYPSLIEQASALAYSLVNNHPFVDGNKRIGHAAMEVFLVLNGLEIECNVDEQEEFFFQLAAGSKGREDLIAWLKKNVVTLSA